MIKEEHLQQVRDHLLRVMKSGNFDQVIGASHAFIALLEVTK